MPESESYHPTDLIVQEGPNRGNIADKALAEIGADAEALQREINEDNEKMGIAHNRRAQVFKSGDPDRAGLRAMGAEVSWRATPENKKEQALAEGHLPTSENMDAHNKGKKFELHQQFHSSERRDALEEAAQQDSATPESQV